MRGQILILENNNIIAREWHEEGTWLDIASYLEEFMYENARLVDHGKI